jgi:hypothetical protein
MSTVRDASDAGMNKAMIVLGHANSEEAGMAYCGSLGILPVIWG